MTLWMARNALGRHTNKRGLLCRIGKRLASHYRAAHGGQKPVTRTQYVDNRVIDVNHYTNKDWDEGGFGAAVREEVARWEEEQADAPQKRKRRRKT